MEAVDYKIIWKGEKNKSLGCELKGGKTRKTPL
jgi:hypothetical protein